MRFVCQHRGVLLFVVVTRFALLTYVEDIPGLLFVERFVSTKRTLPFCSDKMLRKKSSILFLSCSPFGRYFDITKRKTLRFVFVLVEPLGSALENVNLASSDERGFTRIMIV